MELVIMGIFMCIAFCLGRFTIKPKETVVPKIFKKKKQEPKLDEATITMLENIDNYDGTSSMQKDVPEEV